MKKYLFFLIVAASLVPVSAYGLDLKGIQPLPPYGVFSTFSAESLKKGKLAVALEAEISRETDYYRFTARSGYGLTDTIELGISVPYVLEWQDRVDGFEDISLCLKHRFIDEGKYGPSVAYLLNASLPSGSDTFTTEGSYGAGIIVSKKIGPFTGHANLLYSRPGTNRFEDDLTFAGGLDFSAAHNFNMLGEIYGKKSYSGKLDNLELRFGYRIMTAEDVFTTIGAGLDIKNRDPEYRILFSVSYRFPPEKKQIQRIEEIQD